MVSGYSDERITAYIRPFCPGRIPTLFISGVKGLCIWYSNTYHTASYFLWNDYQKIHELCKE